MKSIQIILAKEKNHCPFEHQMMRKKNHHILLICDWRMYGIIHVWGQIWMNNKYAYKITH